MQPALCFSETRPAPSAGVLAWLNRAGAMRATDAREILVVQWIVEDVMFVDVVPDHLHGPVSQRIDFYQLIFLIPLHFAGICAVFRLIAAYRGPPGFQLRQL